MKKLSRILHKYHTDEIVGIILIVLMAIVLFYMFTHGACSLINLVTEKLIVR